MDEAIRPVTPKIMRERGAFAFDEGRGIDDHHMNPGAPAIADWQAAWRERQAAAFAAAVVKSAMEVTPP